jgi:hypothetical protein
MSLKENLIKLSELKDMGEWYSEEIKEKVYYLKLNTKDGTELGKLMQSDADIVAKVLIKSICEKDGTLVFAKGDIGYINKMPISFTSELFEKVLIFNKMLPESVKEAEKN